MRKCEVKMSGRYTTILVSFFAGLLGGIVPRLFIAERVAFAQNPQDALQKYKAIPTPATKVIRAERIELVNNRGKALAVLEVGYGKALPAGSPMLTFTDRDELFQKDRKVVLTTAQFSMYNGQEESSTLAPGAGLTFRDATGGGGIGRTLTMIGHVVSIFPWSGFHTGYEALSRDACLAQRPEWQLHSRSA